MKDAPQGQVIRTQTQNVGAGGLCVLLEQPLERFSTLTLRLELDPSLPFIECQGKVVWVVPSREAVTKKNCFDTGIEFLKLEPAHQDLVRRYIESRIEEKSAR